MIYYLLLSFTLLFSYIFSFRLLKVADNPTNIQLWFIGLIILVFLSLIMSVKVMPSQRLKACAIYLLVVLTVSFSVSRFTAFSLGYSYDIATSRSNEPTIEIGDITISRHFDLHLRKGVFVGFNSGKYGVLRKKIVGEPFDQIIVCHDNVYVNGEPIKHIKTNQPSICPFPYLSMSLKKQEYFVLGDNYGNSIDSRTFGAVKLNDIFAVSLYKVGENGEVNFL